MLGARWRAVYGVGNQYYARTLSLKTSHIRNYAKKPSNDQNANLEVQLNIPPRLRQNPDLVERAKKFAEKNQTDGKGLDKYISMARERNTEGLTKSGFKYDKASRGYIREWINPEYARELEENAKTKLDEEAYMTDTENISMDDILNDAEDFLLRKGTPSRSQPPVKGLRYLGDPYFQTSFKKSMGQTDHEIQKQHKLRTRSQEPKLTFKELLEKNRNARQKQEVAKDDYFEKEDGQVQIEPVEDEDEPFPVLTDDIYKLQGYKKFIVDEEFLDDYDVWLREFGAPLSLNVLLDLTNDPQYVFEQEYDNEIAGLKELLDHETSAEQEARENAEKRRKEIEDKMQNKPIHLMWQVMLKEGLVNARGADVQKKTPKIAYKFGKIDGGRIGRVKYLPKIKQKALKMDPRAKDIVSAFKILPKKINARVAHQRTREELGLPPRKKLDLKQHAEDIRDMLKLASMKQIYKTVTGRTDVENADLLPEEERLRLGQVIEEMNKNGTTAEIDKMIEDEVKQIIRKKIAKRKAQIRKDERIKEKQMDQELKYMEKVFGKLEPDEENEEDQKYANLITPEMERMYETEKYDFFQKAYPELASKGVTVDMFEKGFDEVMPEMVGEPQYEEAKRAFYKQQQEATEYIVSTALPGVIEGIQNMTHDLSESTRMQIFSQVLQSDDSKMDAMLNNPALDEEQRKSVEEALNIARSTGANLNNADSADLLAKLLGVDPNKV
jgi:hypothetical protein